MKPFLYSIAEAYLLNDSENLSNYCFVFPNKRSEVFFHHAFAGASRLHNIHTIHPASSTITDFIESLTDGLPADRMEMVFILYNAYREIIYKAAGQDMAARELAETIDFNKFQRWADMIIGDFNDVDMYLVDPAAIFPNLKRFKEISSNYLSEEILQEIRRHWHPDNLPQETDDSFWNHILHDGDNPDDNEGKARDFFKLWQIMLELYERFRNSLRRKNLYYTGMAYRDTVEILSDRTRDDFPFKRYIFVGFNMLSKAEEKVFRLLKQMSDKDSGTDDGVFADFYFDTASPAFESEWNSAGTFLRRYTRLFPSVYDCVKPVREFPRIEITGVASTIGQAKLAGTIVSNLYPANNNGEPDGWKIDNLRQTAVILPKENLAQGVVASLPKWINPVNLTMGYKLRDSSMASLVRDIVSLHLRSRKSRGVTPTFFYEDVIAVLTHPVIRQFFSRESSAIIYDINVNRRYNIPENYFTENYPQLKEIFGYVDNHFDINEVFGYFKRLLTALVSLWDRTDNSANNTGDTDTDTTDGSQEVSSDSEINYDLDGSEIVKGEKTGAVSLLDRMLAKAYLRAVERLEDISLRYFGDSPVFLADTTLLHFIERMIGGETVNFEGKPLNGLQIMGVLEARNLDFENIIIPSMNENIFPRRHFVKSFIPPHLRSAYGMSTQEHQESIYSYYFYRMISRARRVFLLYDVRTQGVGSGQVSRFINQLKYIYHPARLTERVLGYNVESRTVDPVFVNKTPEIMEVLARYRATDNPRHLSASAINQYINCPLSFYLSYIAGFEREDEFHDYMDEGTYGTIIHGVLEDLYSAWKKELGPDSWFDRERIKQFSKRTVEIDKAITRRINRHYNRLGDNSLASLKGDAEIFGKIIKKYILLILQRDGETGPFRFIAGEYGHPIRLVLNGSDRSIEINFRFSIDRIDYIKDAEGNDLVRIIDYKTGSEETTISDIRDMFVKPTKGNKSRAKAMLQLFLYCQALSQCSSGKNIAVQPWIYTIRKVAKDGFAPLSLECMVIDDNKGKEVKMKFPILDYREYVEEFNDQMIDLLEDLFNPEIPFTSAADSHACTFCKFTEICRKK